MSERSNTSETSKFKETSETRDESKITNISNTCNFVPVFQGAPHPVRVLLVGFRADDGGAMQAFCNKS